MAKKENEEWRDSEWFSASVSHLDAEGTLLFCIRWLIEKDVVSNKKNIVQLKGLTIEEIMGAMVAGYRELRDYKAALQEEAERET